VICPLTSSRMMTITFLRHLKQQLGVYKFFHCTTYLWDEREGQVTLICGSRRRMFVHYLGYICNSGYALAMALHLSFSSSLSLAQRCAGIPFFCLQLTSLVFRWDWRFQVDKRPADYLNGMLRFEKLLLKGTIIFPER
jgi:hypothetical protein